MISFSIAYRVISFCIVDICADIKIISIHLIHYECTINIFNSDFWFIFSD